MKKAEWEKLAKDFKECREMAVGSIAGMEDGGTCNMDSPILVGVPFGKKLDAVFKETGIGGWRHRRGTVLAIRAGGQAHTRTHAAEVFEKAMEERGWTMSMWYQVD